MSEIIQNIKLKARILELEAELAGLHSILNDPIAIMKQKQLIEHLEKCNTGQATQITELEATIKSREANIKMRADHAERLQDELLTHQAEANDLRLHVAGLLIEIEDLSNE